MKYPKILKLIFAISALALLTNCGASKTSKNSDASRLAGSPVYDAPPTGTGGSGVYTNCNAIPSNNIGLGGPISSYFDPNAQAYIDDWIRLKFNQRPTQLTSSSTHYIEIYRWKEGGVYNRTPVSISFQLKGSGQELQQTTQVLSRATVQNMIVDNGLDRFGYTTDNFYDGVIMILKGMDLEWDAITIYYYDDSESSDPIDSVDVLLPAFDANPNSYATTHPDTDLQMLHPMYQYRNSGFDDLDYYNATFQLCAGF